ncbi:STAS domain-containing protein [Aquihabitans sp. G128]|uniref:STAS domain-containing protein n=1 Tax=Aquihabitans sp. G128 TaxID=2849779 RepID=UPI001C221A31|nr:STAS domain-containing protein [Aquihabitans sp. G128]QXC62204.1 STAS domain-containing protein [Aquihabitans sp. G128]
MAETEGQPANEAFHVATHRTGFTETVTVTGELDLATAPALAAAVSEAIAAGVGKIVLDASGLTYIDSIGISLLVRAWNEMKGRATMPVVVTNLQPNVRRVLEVCGIVNLVTE